MMRLVIPHQLICSRVFEIHPNVKKIKKMVRSDFIAVDCRAAFQRRTGVLKYCTTKEKVGFFEKWVLSIFSIFSILYCTGGRPVQYRIVKY